MHRQSTIWKFIPCHNNVMLSQHDGRVTHFTSLIFQENCDKVVAQSVSGLSNTSHSYIGSVLPVLQCSALPWTTLDWNALFWCAVHCHALQGLFCTSRHCYVPWGTVLNVNAVLCTSRQCSAQLNPVMHCQALFFNAAICSALFCTMHVMCSLFSTMHVMCSLFYSVRSVLTILQCTVWAHYSTMYGLCSLSTMYGLCSLFYNVRSVLTILQCTVCPHYSAMYSLCSLFYNVRSWYFYFEPPEPLPLSRWSWNIRPLTVSVQWAEANYCGLFKPCHFKAPLNFLRMALQTGLCQLREKYPLLNF